MAISKIKATYSLDPETIEKLERASKRWGVSKSEALRRAIDAADETSGETRVAMLERAQRLAGLDARKAAAWIREIRAERRASRR